MTVAASSVFQPNLRCWADEIGLFDEQAANVESESTGQPAPSSRIVYDSPQTQQWRIGLVLDPPVTCRDVYATFPIPQNWPEQKISCVNQVIDPLVVGWDSRDLASGVKQIQLRMARVPAGVRTETSFTFQIERSRTLPPQKTDDFVIPRRPDRSLRIYFGNSPNIDASNSIIRSASRELAAMEAESDWQRVEQIYDYVRENVEYVEGSLKNASVALRDGKGDCEEMTSLFVALCRNAKVPARMVWVPGHCYPEFYLEDGDGKGYWFPCQAAGTRQFGGMEEYRPVLQKGDRFRVPEKRTPVRYVAEFFKCERTGKSNPRPEFIRERVDA
ncbi:Transglutaminase-like superfamily protein [Planctomycetes bacterium CA13]|uniref:Transglutaminase-like superfamily protein n=2 Tax=Novipirellula herctigrandis TaxID=2527986 RepID=A0A5C5YZL8_9BACT|nr:Transglutaminase-like superfamily protein [Planctomycetes bacterium CA13]